MIEGSTKLDKSIAHLLARISELEKSQKELAEAVASKIKTKEQTMALPPMDVDPVQSSSSNPSPHHSFAGSTYAVTYPTVYANTHATTNNTVYPYIPYFADSGAYAAAPSNWTGQSLDANFAKMSREQRAQHIQGRFGGTGGNYQSQGHPAFKTGDRKSRGIGYQYGTDGANGS